MIETIKKYKVGGIIGGAFFLLAYYFMDAKKSISMQILGITFQKYAFWIDLTGAILIGMVLNYVAERYAK